MARIDNPIKDNRSLWKAKANKSDEFYTLLDTVQQELKHYRKHFKGKVVFCNCDDPLKSNFFRYFALNFNSLGLKSLIATCYVDSPLVGGQLSLFETEEPTEEMKRPHKIVINSVEDYTGNGAVDMADVEWLLRHGNNVLTELEGDGDFRSPECVELLKQSDIVVTNPPFSLLREYVAQLMEYGKKFLIIGNENAITYKEYFPYLMENKIWLGYHYGHTLFAVPDTYEIPEHLKGSDRARVRGAGYKVDENGRLWRDLGNICWFTNLDHKKRHEPLDLFKPYDPNVYPTYDNYNAIEVGQVVDIPCDYAGVMGVPVTFLEKYCPDQFEILGLSQKVGFGLKSTKLYDSYRETRQDGSLTGASGKKMNGNPVLAGKPSKGNYYIDDEGNSAYSKYARIFIRNLNPEKPLE